MPWCSQWYDHRMRTTIKIEATLLLELKRRASREGTTVSKLIENAVRLSLRSNQPQMERPEFQLITYGIGAEFTAHNIDKPARLLEHEDVTRLAPSGDPS